MSKTLVYLDTETTGNTPEDVLCQIAYGTAPFETGIMDSESIFCELYKPHKKIPPEASAVTHITNKMVADKIAFKNSPEYTTIKTLLEHPDTIMVAHNAKFDVGMLVKEGITPSNVICTLRLARHLDKENKIPRYNLQYLRYFLEMEIDAQAHDAKGDILVLAELFPRLKQKLIKDMDPETEDVLLEELLAISARPSLMHMFTFGKYNGMSVQEVASLDPGYLKWMLEQKKQNPADEEDWIYTLEKTLQ